jgi:hypothetical protein
MIFWDVVLAALVVGALAVIYYALRTYYDFRKRMR